MRKSGEGIYTQDWEDSITSDTFSVENRYTRKTEGNTIGGGFISKFYLFTRSNSANYLLLSLNASFTRTYTKVERFDSPRYYWYYPLDTSVVERFDTTYVKDYRIYGDIGYETFFRFRQKKFSIGVEIPLGKVSRR